MSRCVGVYVILLRFEALAGDALGGGGGATRLTAVPRSSLAGGRTPAAPCGLWLSICAGCLCLQQQHCRRRGRFSTCRSTVLAAITVRTGFLGIDKAVIVSLNARLHTSHIDPSISEHRSGFSQSLPRNGCRFITCFVTVFATVIALTKDLADIEGDRQYNIETFATRLGPNRLAMLGARLCASWRCGADESCINLT